MSKTALLVVDVQEALVAENPYNKEFTINKIENLINNCRNNGLEVIYVQHDGGKGDELEAGTSGWQIYKQISPKDGEKIVAKNYNSSFKNTELKDYLNEKHIDTIVLVGMQTEYCLDTTCKVAFEHGFKLIIPEGTNTTFDNEYMTGKEIYEYYNFKIWNNRFAKLEKFEAVMDIISSNNQ